MNDHESQQIERLLLHRAIASSQNGITIGRVDRGQIPLIYANPAFYRLTGYGPEDVIGKDCRLLQAIHDAVMPVRDIALIIRYRCNVCSSVALSA